MRKVVWIFIAVGWSVVTRGQQSAAPTAPAPAPPAVPAPAQRPAPLPPGRTFDLTNTTKNPALATNNAPNPLATTNLNPTTNALTQTGIPTNQQTGIPMTNQLTPTGFLPSQLTNQVTNGSTQQGNFSITNTLSRMAPAQKAKVLQVQNGLVSLQTIAMTIGRVQNVQQVTATPQIQQQVQAVSTQIAALALGSVKPSQESTLRLSQDLLQGFAQGRLVPDQLLVLAVVLDHISNSGSLTPAQIDDTINTAAATLQGGGVPLALSQPVTYDLHSIASELQPALAR